VSQDPSLEEPFDIDITDAIHLLSYLFPTGSPPPPAAPFPTCGQPSTGVQVSEAMKCKAFTCK